MDAILERLSTSVTAARTVEELTRPLLELLESITGLESTYLTLVDLQQGVQKILYINYGGASVGVLAVEPGHHEVERVLQGADALMYETKTARRAAR